MEWADRIGRRIRLRDLHIALAVAQTGSMLKAGEHLAISQPVVSKVIADLERALGVRLFDRSRRGVEPTAAGRALLNRGRAAFDELREGVKEVEFLTDPTAGELRIAATENMVAGLIPAVVDRLSRQHTRMVFHVTQALSAVGQFRELRDRDVELLVCRLPQTFSEEDLSVEVLFDDPFCYSGGHA
jgi:DNA-binding transcriptional LysR family regulator